jgi:hypothetical protein
MTVFQESGKAKLNKETVCNYISINVTEYNAFVSRSFAC